MTLNRFCSWQIPTFQESLLSDVIRPIVGNHLKRFRQDQEEGQVGTDGDAL